MTVPITSATSRPRGAMRPSCAKISRQSRLCRRLCLWQNTRQETILDAAGARKTRIRHLPRSQWQVLIPEHHPGFIDRQTYEANQQRLAENTRPEPHNSGGAVREGGALLQGLASCGHCGRRLHTHYRGRNSSPGYHCAGKVPIESRGVYCLNIGGVQIDDACEPRTPDLGFHTPRCRRTSGRPLQLRRHWLCIWHRRSSERPLDIPCRTEDRT